MPTSVFLTPAGAGDGDACLGLGVWALAWRACLFFPEMSPVPLCVTTVMGQV
jgi:hypothetical protein